MKFIKNHPYLFGEIIDLAVAVISFTYILTHDVPDTWVMTYLWLFLGYGSLAGIIAVPIIIAVVRGIIDHKRKKRKEQELKEYREKYVTGFVVEDKNFGNLVFEKDSNKNLFRFIRGDIMQMPFGKYDYCDVDMEIDGNEDMLYRALDDLAKVYSEHEKYMNDLYYETVDTCYDWDERDSKGNPIDRDYVEKYFSLFAVSLTTYEDEVTVSLCGTLLNDDDEGMELLGCHIVEADINCTKNEVTYNLVG